MKDSFDLETIWILYIMLYVNPSTITDDVIAAVIDSGNELATLMLYEEIRDRISADQIQVIVQKSRSWLLLYQLYYHGTIKTQDLSRKIGSGTWIEYYTKLKRKKITLYEPITLKGVTADAVSN